MRLPSYISQLSKAFSFASFLMPPLHWFWYSTVYISLIPLVGHKLVLPLIFSGSLFHLGYEIFASLYLRKPFLYFIFALLPLFRRLFYVALFSLLGLHFSLFSFLGLTVDFFCCLWQYHLRTVPHLFHHWLINQPSLFRYLVMLSSFCQLPHFDFLVELLYAFTNLLIPSQILHLLFYVMKQLLFLISLSYWSSTLLEPFFVHEIFCVRYCSLRPRANHYLFSLFLVFSTISFLYFGWHFLVLNSLHPSILALPPNAPCIN